MNKSPKLDISSFDSFAEVNKVPMTAILNKIFVNGEMRDGKELPTLAHHNLQAPRISSMDVSYIYLDTFDDNVFEATLTSPTIDKERQCFVFRYHMKGTDVGNLTITVSSVATITIFDHQSDSWRCGIIFIPNSGVSIQLTGYRRGLLEYGIISLDALTFIDSDESACTTDVYMSTTECETLTPISTSPPTTPTNQPQDTTSSNAWPDYMTYAIAIPGGILVISVISIIVGVCYKRSKNNTYLSSAEMPSLNVNPRHEYHRPSEALSERYPDVFGDKRHQDTEVYDYIDEKMISNDGADDYLTPTNNDEGYTVLPAITKKLENYGSNYVEPRDLNLSNRPGKKISISEQGDVQYTDVRNHGQRSRVPSKVYTITQDYLDMTK
ncbi:hypothetical protein FSP39_013512 [Pinctada imbricata]|uniref:MAM domain-containing protein n=1 Tax=Pinctada imbricata TaxID=66713 RepID=A0AA88XK70_PINIB|nr:hypothetical protein FSP39_013512 [Pinctada imbricata]